ncbi:hypothetical protein ACFX2J_040152 [Malus domestica]
MKRRKRKRRKKNINKQKKGERSSKQTAALRQQKEDREKWEREKSVESRRDSWERSRRRECGGQHVKGSKRETGEQLAWESQKGETNQRKKRREYKNRKDCIRGGIGGRQRAAFGSVQQGTRETESRKGRCLGQRNQVRGESEDRETCRRVGEGVRIREGSVDW